MRQSPFCLFFRSLYLSPCCKAHDGLLIHFIADKLALHTACLLYTSSYLIYGFSSPIFAMAFVLALIVMYDATGVRWAAGLHAKAINYIVEYLGDENTKDKDQLKEMRCV